MLPPLNIEIPRSACWQEGKALRDVLDTDRLSPSGENAEHIVKVKVSCLSGVKAEVPSDPIAVDAEYEVASPNRMRAMVAIFSNGEAKGSSSFSEPLSTSASWMLADNPTNRFVALWRNAQGVGGSSIEFQIPLKTFNGKVDREEFEMLVFLADHSDERQSVIAYPIGIGSFVVGDEAACKNKVVDIRIKRINSTASFPAMEIQKQPKENEHGMHKGPPTINFIHISSSPLSQATASTYKLDSRGGGFLRMTVDWECKQRPSPEPFSRKLSPKRECDDAPRSSESQGELSPEDVTLQRKSRAHLPTETPREGFDEISDREQSEIVLSDGEGFRRRSVVRMASSLKFPTRTSTKILSPQDKLQHFDNQKQHLKHPNVTHEEKLQGNLKYTFSQERREVHPKGKKALAQSCSVSFDDESLLTDARPMSAAESSFVLSPTEDHSVEEASIRGGESTTARILTEVLRLVDAAFACSAHRPSGSLATNTWNTLEDDDKTFGTLDRSLVDEDNTFLEEFVSSTLNAFDSDFLCSRLDDLRSARKHPTKGFRRGRDPVLHSRTIWSNTQHAHKEIKSRNKSSKMKTSKRQDSMQSSVRGKRDCAANNSSSSTTANNKNKRNKNVAAQEWL